jgi:hypothetical protein
MTLNIQKTIEKVKKLKEAYHNSAKDLVAPALQALVSGKIKSFKFACYTPFFNDGDECKYRVCEPYFQINKDLAELSVGEEVNVTAFSQRGKIVDVRDDGLLTVKLNTGKSVTLPVSEITLVANDEDFEDSYSLEGEAEKQAKQIEEFIESIPADVIKDIFDDHVEVIVTADGVTVEEYEHE